MHTLQKADIYMVLFLMMQHWQERPLLVFLFVIMNSNILTYKSHKIRRESLLIQKQNWYPKTPDRLERRISSNEKAFNIY